MTPNSCRADLAKILSNVTTKIFVSEGDCMISVRQAKEFFLSAEDISLALAEFYKNLDGNTLAELRLYGGHIWFTWQGVKPADLSLNLHIGDPNDRTNTQWLDYGDEHIPLEADQYIEYHTDGSPDLDPLVTAQWRDNLAALADAHSEAAYASIKSRESTD